MQNILADCMQKILADCMHTWANVIILYLTAAEINTYWLTSPFLSLSFSLSHPLHSLSFLFEDAGRIYSFHSQFSVFSFPTVWGCIVGSALLPVANFKHISSRRLTLSAHICCLLPLPAARCMLPLPLCCLLADDALSMTAASPATPSPHTHTHTDRWTRGGINNSKLFPLFWVLCTAVKKERLFAFSCNRRTHVARIEISDEELDGTWGMLKRQ